MKCCCFNTGSHALQAYRSEKSRRHRDEEEEQDAPAPMTTRLRKRAERRREKATEREREKEREQQRPIEETISISDEAEEERCPSLWDVEQVFSYINSLPGDAVIFNTSTISIC